MGGHGGSAHTARHNEDSFIFNTMECLSHSTLCGEDWLSLCDVSWEAAPPPPLSDRHMFQLLSAAAGQGKSRLLFFFLPSEPMNWWLRCEMWAGTLCPADAYISLCHSNISQQDGFWGSGARVPEVCHCVTTICWAQKKNKSIKASEMLTLSS